MSLLSLTQSARWLGIDPKTLRTWVRQAQLPWQAHPQDARLNCLSLLQLQQLAQAHHRQRPEDSAAGVSAEAEVGALAQLTQQLEGLHVQLAQVQEQLSVLTASGFVPPLALSAPGEQGELTARQNSREFAWPETVTDRRKIPHVLSRVEYGTQGTYILISPEHGKLDVQPETPEWFAWLNTLASFRFVGSQGHFTAYRGYGCSPSVSWWAYRCIQNHSCKRRLGRTEALSIETLELAAASLQALL